MTDRICSCCGTPYTDEERHDYEKCVKDCEFRVAQAKHNLSDSMDCLEMALARRRAQRGGKLK